MTTTTWSYKTLQESELIAIACRKVVWADSTILNTKWCKGCLLGSAKWLDKGRHYYICMYYIGKKHLLRNHLTYFCGDAIQIPFLNAVYDWRILYSTGAARPLHICTMHSGLENLKKSRSKNLWNQINQFHEKYFGPNSIFSDFKNGQKSIFERGKV